MAKLFVEQGAKVLMAARREELVEAAAKDIGKHAIGIKEKAARLDARRWPLIFGDPATR